MIHPVLNVFVSQIYLSWKSGPAEVKHWKDMISHPRTTVAQWHSLKAWGAQEPNCLKCYPTPPGSQPERLSTHPFSLNAVLGCRPCITSLFSGLFDIPRPQSLWISPKIAPPCQVLIATWLFYIGLNELQNVFDILAPLCPLSVPFISQDIFQSFFHHISHS